MGVGREAVYRMVSDVVLVGGGSSSQNVWLCGLSYIVCSGGLCWRCVRGTGIRRWCWVGCLHWLRCVVARRAGQCLRVYAPCGVCVGGLRVGHGSRCTIRSRYFARGVRRCMVAGRLVGDTDLGKGGVHGHG